MHRQFTDYEVFRLPALSECTRAIQHGTITLLCASYFTVPQITIHSTISSMLSVTTYVVVWYLPVTAYSYCYFV